MGEVVQGRFKNYFTDTAGVNEYFKFRDGEEVNPERILVTPSDVYLVGTQTEEPVVQGHGGRKFWFWMNDGTLVQLKDIWHLKDRDTEEVNVIKMENVYLPKEGSLQFTTLHGTEITEEECLLYNIPWFMKDAISSNTLKVFSKAEALKVCEGHLKSTLGRVSDLILAGLIRDIEKSDKQFVLFISEARDLIDADVQLLKMIHAGVAKFKEYEPIILQSGWQHSVDPFSELLTKLKSEYFDIVSGNRKAVFAELIMELRHVLLHNKEVKSMNMF